MECAPTVHDEAIFASRPELRSVLDRVPRSAPRGHPEPCRDDIRRVMLLPELLQQGARSEEEEEEEEGNDEEEEEEEE